MKKNDTLKSIIVLVAICIVIAAAMAGVNMLTKDRIAQVQAEKEAKALEAVLPENAGFEKLPDNSELPKTVKAVYRDKDGEGIAMLLSASGHDSSNPISIAVGFDKDGKIEKCYVISCTGETSGIGTKVKNESFLSQFDGKGDTDGVDTISGATISSSAFLDAVKDAFKTLSTINISTEVDK
jgi:electron transport complex protein RnfG